MKEPEDVAAEEAVADQEEEEMAAEEAEEAEVAQEEAIEVAQETEAQEELLVAHHQLKVLNESELHLSFNDFHL